MFCKGYTWGFFSREGEWQRPEARASLERLKEDGCEWICLPVNAWQETWHSLHIFSLYGRTQTDADVRYAVKMIHEMGMKVCLKPMVNCLDGVWRSMIRFPDDERVTHWDQWFRSYESFLCHYASLAEETGCEMLCTGCEMGGMDSQAEHCRRLIAAVRGKYSGPLMHNINHGQETDFSWLDAVDLIGISAYYPITRGNSPTRAVMKAGWERVMPGLTACHEKFGRPVMFAEIGVRNESGCTAYPWDFQNRPDVPADEQEQADFYETAMEATWDIPWFQGYFWWDWKAILPPEETMHENRDFIVFGKQAEQVLKKWYLEKKAEAAVMDPGKTGCQKENDL